MNNLKKACQPLTPEQTLETLQELYEELESSPGWVTDEDLQALNAGIEVLKLAMSEHCPKCGTETYTLAGHPYCHGCCKWVEHCDCKLPPEEK